MKDRNHLRLYQKHRILAMLLAAAVLLLSIYFIQDSFVYADGEKNTGSSTEGSTGSTEASEGEEASDITSNLLKDDHGRIVFWEWTKVTPANYKQHFRWKDEDGNYRPYYASMLVMHNSNLEPVGFISTYDDKDHIFYGEDMFQWTTNYNYLGDKDPEKLQAIYKSINEGKGNLGHNATEMFDYKVHYYIKLDEESKSLNANKEVFSQDRFYTAGTSMGVPYFSPVNRGLQNDFFEERIKSDGYEHATMQIALARASSKGNSADMSYNSIGKNLNGNMNTFLTAGYDMGSIGFRLRDHEEGLTVYRRIGPISDEDREKDDDTRMDETHYQAKDNKSTFPSFGTENVDFSNDISFFGLYPFLGDSAGDKWVMLSEENGFTFLAEKNGYLVNLSFAYLLTQKQITDSYATVGVPDRAENATRLIKSLLSAKDSSVNHIFSWYIGKPHVFASLKGEGGDPVSGAGGTTKVGKGETMILKDTSYLDVDGNEAKSEGVVLPEGSKIEIEEGGVLSIEGNFINNGTIINKGGTIVIKEEGCVSPFGVTNESRIECSKAENGQGGNIIVMPGGRLYCLGSDAQFGAEGVPLSGLKPNLLLTGGSSLINYGTFVTTLTKMDSSSKIENRKDAVAFLGYNREDTGVLLYYSAVGKNSIKGIVPLTGRKVYFGGIHEISLVLLNSRGGLTYQTSKGTVYTEPTATLNYTDSEKDLASGADYITPEY